MKALTNHPKTKEILLKKVLSRKKRLSVNMRASRTDQQSYITADNKGTVTIHRYDPNQARYIEIKTKLATKEAENMTLQELDSFALKLLSGQEQEAVEHVSIQEIEAPEIGTHVVQGKNTIRKLQVGIYSTETEDERALHALLTQVRRYTK